MIIFEVLLLCLWVLFGVFVVTQLVIPLFTSTKVFPLFRKNRSALNEQLVQVTDELFAEKLKQQIVDIKLKLYSERKNTENSEQSINEVNPDGKE